MFVLRHLRRALPPCLSCNVLPWLNNSYRGPLMLIIIKLLTLDNNNVDHLSVHTLFMRLKSLSHSAVLQGMVCMYRFRLS